MHSALSAFAQGGIQQLRGQDEGGGGTKLSVLVHAQGIKTVHAGEWVGGGPKMAKFCPRSC